MPRKTVRSYARDSWCALRAWHFEGPNLILRYGLELVTDRKLSCFELYLVPVNSAQAISNGVFALDFVATVDSAYYLRQTPRPQSELTFPI